MCCADFAKFPKFANFERNLEPLSGMLTLTRSLVEL